MIFTWESLIGWRKRYLNPHHRSYHPSSISDAWMDFTLWIKEVFLWVTGLKHDPEVLTHESAAFKILNDLVCKEVDLDKPTVSWINHSTFLLDYQGVRFLTDPIWADRCSPINGFGPKRKHRVPFALEALGNVDYVLISHNHFDHLDAYTVKRLAKLQPHITYFVPEGCGAWMRAHGFERVIELGWWGSYALEHGPLQLRITAVPAQHFSGRGLFDVNDTLWVGWVVEFFDLRWRSKSFYFCGDTGYNPIDFREIGRRFGPFDLSLIPIGAYLPRQIMSTIHVNPYEALLIHKDVRSALSVGCHFHTFTLAQEHMTQPPYDLLQAMEMQHFPKDQFLLMNTGGRINW